MTESPATDLFVFDHWRESIGLIIVVCITFEDFDFVDLFSISAHHGSHRQIECHFRPLQLNNEQTLFFPKQPELPTENTSSPFPSLSLSLSLFSKREREEETHDLIISIPIKTYRAASTCRRHCFSLFG